MSVATTRSAAAEVERWLRLLRLHGQVGTALQALGTSEGPLPESGESAVSDHAPAAGSDRDAVAQVTEQAVRVAGEHGARAITTADVLVAVMHVYGEEFDRALRAHGTDRQEVLGRLGLDSSAPQDN